MRFPFFPARQSAAGIEPQLFRLSMEHTDVLDSICLLVAALPLTLFLRGVPHPMNDALALIPLAPALARAAVIARLKYRWATACAMAAARVSGRAHWAPPPSCSAPASALPISASS